MGYDLTPIDASESMVIATTRLTGLPAHQLRFQDVAFQNAFDGIWACASLLHVPKAGLCDVLNRLARSLRTNGVCYFSFKVGTGEREHGERQFTDFTPLSLEGFLVTHGDFEVVRIWTTDDSRTTRTDRWVNALVKKQSA